VDKLQHTSRSRCSVVYRSGVTAWVQKGLLRDEIQQLRSVRLELRSIVMLDMLKHFLIKVGRVFGT